MKWVGEDFIIHGLFVDDMQHTSTSQALMNRQPIIRHEAPIRGNLGEV